MKIDNALLRQIDAAARRHGISRTAFMSMAAAQALRLDEVSSA
jgi:hypothetical protein